METNKRKYLTILARQYPSMIAASTEIINLQAILSLPKGTEHFLTDLHGEYEQFNHVLRNGSGSVKRKVEEVFGSSLSDADKRELATIIYYPAEKLALLRTQRDLQSDWYVTILHRLVQVAKRVSSKYTRSKVRKAIPQGYAYVIEELITEKAEIQDKERYYKKILQTIVNIGDADEFIEVLCDLIQQLVIDRLHIIGDVFDRGPAAHKIMDTLMHYHSVDIQWGNHDVVWMGAAAGQGACIANVIRMSAKYGNLSTIEEGYGINLIPLVMFAMETYHDVSCFTVEGCPQGSEEALMTRKMLKAITVIQLKLEGQIIKKHPEFGMDDRLFLDKINYAAGTVVIGGKEYPLRDTEFPTVDVRHPYRLSKEETAVMEKIRHSFTHSEKLQRHVKFLFSKGGLYKVCNSNLLYHGCVPLDADGNFTKVSIYGKEYAGKALYDALEHWARKGYYEKEGTERTKGQDLIWYIWNGPNSPVYGKDKMTTFERIYIADETQWKEIKNNYYRLLNDEEVVNRILREFSLNEAESHIVNGHVPVEQLKGETPMKCGGKLLVIDGGFSKVYHDKTGIAGYTLISNSYGMRLIAHETFESTEAAIRKETDIVSDTQTIETYQQRKYVGDTDIGTELKESIKELQELLEAYRKGDMRQK